MRDRLAAAGLAALTVGGCQEGGPPTATPDDSTYVQVMARLAFIRQRAGPAGSADTLRWADSARLSVLEDFGVDAEALERYATVHGDDPLHMARVWERVDAVVDEIAVRAARSEGPVDLGRDSTGPRGRDPPGAADPAGGTADTASGLEDDPAGGPDGGDPSDESRASSTRTETRAP